MNLNHQQLINLPVYSVSKNYLGRVSGFDFNTHNHKIVKYYVSQSSFVKDVLGTLNQSFDLEISSSQVISINEEKMIVEDNVEKDFAFAHEKIKKQATAPVSLFKTSE